MNNIIKPLIGIALLAPAITANGATPDNDQQRHINLTALRLIEEYERYSTLRNDEYIENFKYIFGNDTIWLYNDLPGLSDGEIILINDYIDKVKSAKGVKFILKNINGGLITDGGDVWFTTLTFDKAVEYSTQCGAMIESAEYYDGADYKMTAVVSINKSTGEGHIDSLTGKIDSHRERLVPGFALIQYNDPRDKEVINNGRKLTFNKYNQAYSTPPFNWKIDDDDVNMHVIESGSDACREFAFEYHPTRWRVRPQYSMSLGDVYKVDSPEGITSSVSGMDIGVDVGYMFPSKGKVKAGLFMGVGISTGKVNLTSDDMNYSYSADASADMDADTYTRHYELNGVTQSIKMSHFTVPVYADVEIKVSRRFSVYAQAGLKTYFNAGSKIDSYSGSIYSYGVYPQYQNLMINQPWINSFGNSGFNVDDLVDNKCFKGFSADILLGIGARVRLAGPLSFDLGLAFQPPVIDRMEKSKTEVSLPSGSIPESQAPITYTVADGQVASHALSDYCKIKSTPLRLKVGLTFKF